MPSSKTPHVTQFLQSFLLPAKSLRNSPQITLSAIYPGRDRKPVPSRHSSTQNWNELYTNILDLNRANRFGWGAYFGVAYRKPGLDRWHRGGKNDLIAIPALFTDIDKISTPLNEYLKDLPQPSWIVATSKNSYHVYWLLEEATQQLQRADYILHGIAKYLGSDTSMTIDNPLRLPGSINTKTGAENSLCQIIFAAPHNRYELSQFSRWQDIDSYNSPSKTNNIEILPPPERTVKPISKNEKNEILNPALIDAISQKLIRDYDGRYNRHGWIESYAPCSHKKDQRPGDHFNFDPQTGIGFCYGRHGTLYTNKVASLLNIRISDYGKLFIPQTQQKAL